MDWISALVSLEMSMFSTWVTVASLAEDCNILGVHLSSHLISVTDVSAGLLRKAGPCKRMEPELL